MAVSSVQEFHRALLVAQHDEHRVVAADRADDGGDLHAVEGGACRGAEARHHLHHDEVLRAVGAEDALAQDDLQSSGKVELDLLRAHGVAVAPAADRLLDEVELLDVARDGRLRALNALLLQLREKLLLCFDRLGLNDGQNFLLSVILHVPTLPSTSFLQDIAKALIGKPYELCFIF